MPPRRMARSRTRFRHNRRRTQWVDNVGDTPSLPVGDFCNFDMLQTYRAMPGSETAGITVLRTHIRVWVTSTVVIGDGLIWAMWVDDSEEITLTGGVQTPVPYASTTIANPNSNPYLPLAIYKRENAHPTYNFFGSTNQWEFDLKSKRRVPFGNTWILHLGNFDASAAQTMSYHVRTLIALS